MLRRRHFFTRLLHFWLYTKDMPVWFQICQSQDGISVVDETTTKTIPNIQENVRDFWINYIVNKVVVYIVRAVTFF